MTRVRDVPRERDELVLRWLADSDSGQTHRQIAERDGAHVNTVQRNIAAVLKADREAHK